MYSKVIQQETDDHKKEFLKNIFWMDKSRKVLASFVLFLTILTHLWIRQVSLPVVPLVEVSGENSRR